MAKTTITVLMLFCVGAGALSRSRTGIRSTGEDKSATIYQQYAATYQAAGTAALTTTAETFPRSGACRTGTYISSASVSGVADVGTCENNCRGTSTCKYYSYCPAGSLQCQGNADGKCALYSQNSQCGASTRNGIWAGYTSYEISATTTTTTTTAETFPCSGACTGSGSYISSASVSGVADVGTCEDNCRGTPTCKYYSYCPAGSQCQGANADKCSLYSNSLCGASTYYAGYTSYTISATDVTTVAAATITGDPHMQNVRGVKQDLLAPGTYNILELPSGKGDSLSLIGDVSYIDHPTFCNPLFLTKLRIIGTALGNQEFKFDLGNSSDAQSFSVTRTNLRTKKSEFFQVSEPIKKQFGPVGLSTAQCKKGQVGENSKNCWDSFNTMALKLLGKDGNFLTVNVRRGGQLGFFDVKVNGLNALGLSVGGLLGTNGFSSLGTSTDKTCHNKRRAKLDSMMEIHRDDVHIQQSLLMAKM